MTEGVGREIEGLDILMAFSAGLINASSLEITALMPHCRTSGVSLKGVNLILHNVPTLLPKPSRREKECMVGIKVKKPIGKIWNKRRLQRHGSKPSALRVQGHPCSRKAANLILRN